MLPPFPPLRTVRVGFPTYGSSLSERPDVRMRLHHREILTMKLVMARRMKEHTVLYAIAATSGTPYDVMAVPSSQFGDLLLADGAKPALFLP